MGPGRPSAIGFAGRSLRGAAHGHRGRVRGRATSYEEGPRSPPHRATAPSGTTAPLSGETASVAQPHGRTPTWSVMRTFVLEWRVSPVRVSRREVLVEIGGLRVHLGFTRPPNDDVAEHRHPSSWTQSTVRSAPAVGRIDPMPRRRGDLDIEAAIKVVPRFERRILELDVGEGRQPLAGDLDQARAWLDRGHRASERGQRACRLPGAAAHFEDPRTIIDAGDGDEVSEQVVGVRRPTRS